MELTVQLRSDAIPLGNLLKYAGVVDSGGHAKHLIQAGLVKRNGAVETHRGSQVRPGDVVEVAGETPARILVTRAAAGAD